MDLVSGCPFWPIKDGLPAAFPPLEESARAEVAVLGGGITGAITAYRLIEAGLDTILIDKREIAHGSTCASTALMQYELDLEALQLAEKIGQTAALRAYELSLNAVLTLEKLVHDLGVPCDFIRRPSLYLSHRPAEAKRLRAEAEFRRSHGFEVEYLNAAEITRRFSISAASALYTSIAAEVDVYRLAYGLLAHSAKRGLRVFDRTTVKQIKRTGLGFHLTTQRGTAVTARSVVVATGYEAIRQLRLPAVRLHSTYAVVTEPVSSHWPERCLIWTTQRPYLYLRTTADNRIMIGGADADYDCPEKRGAQLPKKTKTLLKSFHQLFPQIRVEPACSWAGTFADTPDSLPYIGRHPRYPNLYFTLGYGANGMVYSVLGAELIRDAILGCATPDAALFSFARAADNRGRRQHPKHQSATF